MRATPRNPPSRGKTLPESIKEQLSRMDRAYQEVARDFPSVEGDWEFVLLGLRSEIIEQVEAALEERKMTRADLARRMGVSRAHVSQMLNESGNFQLETLAKLAVALDRDIALRFIHKTEQVVVESARRSMAPADHLFKSLEKARKPKPLVFDHYRRSAAPEPKRPASQAKIIELHKAA